MKRKSDQSKKSKRSENKIINDFLIVGIGASAGGIKALKEFFQNVPKDSGMAYVVILHLSPEHESNLAEILQMTANIPVKQVHDKKLQVKPDCVYVIPPNKSLAMNDGHLALSQIKTHEERRAPVDIFFRTLAESHNSRAVSVILSGTGSNGSMGVKRVKEKGGVIFVQDPSEAEYSDMPHNSIATGLVDDILPVAGIPAKIISYKKNLGKIQITVEPQNREENDEKALRDIFTQLRVRTGHDFSNYKRTTVLRRLERRLNVNGLESLSDYSEYIRENTGEAQILLKDLLISVTNFFRDHNAFETLENDIIPKILHGKTSEDSVRIWVTGCATGEEAYSIAMFLAEKTNESINIPKLQIFATDIDENAIQIARDGFYTNSDVADVSPERLRRFFIKEQDGYRVRRELREIVLFAAHNLIKDPPFSRLDLATCRNLLIYLNRSAQARAMEILHFALKPGSYLFLGSSESTDQANDLFVSVNKEAHIYQSRKVAARLPLPIPDTLPSMRFDQALPNQLKSEETRALERLSYAALHLQLLEHYAPPSVVINEEYDIVHMSDRAGRFLQMAGGEPSINLLKIVLPELRLELRTALYQAVQKGISVETRGVSVQINGREENLNIIIRPILRQDDTARGFVLVIFQPSCEIEKENDKIESVDQTEPIAHQLESELTRTKTQLRTTVEQYEVQTEELKASNEELQAMNEELRSATEELETGKEELQSVNEELTTVNQELKIKIEELSQSNSDFENLMSSTDIGTIFLDRSLEIKMFTPTVREIFNLLPADLGRPLSDITAKLDFGELLEDIENVIKTLQTGEREIETQKGNWYLVRLFPYRTAEDRIDGVVITFLDITKRREAEEKLRLSNERLRLVVESVKEYAVITTNIEGHIQSWNAGAKQMFGYTEEEIIGKSTEIIFTPEDRENGIPQKEFQTAIENGSASDERWHLRKDGSRFYVNGVLSELRDEKLIGFVKVARDLTNHKQTEEKLRRAHEELETRVEERTQELAEANETLRLEIKERMKAEEERTHLIKQLVTTQEDERRRIARDMHDHFGQQLTALRLKLQSVKSKCGDIEDLCDLVDETQNIAKTLDSDVSFLVWELRPTALDDLGLRDALANFVRQWSEHFNIPAEFHIGLFDNMRIAEEVEINLYRIAQEALNNTFKHGKATRVNVILEQRKQHLVMIIEDNGIGFDPEQKVNRKQGLGLIGMRERIALVGGSLEIESTPGNGTTIFARVPLEFADKEKWK